METVGSECVVPLGHNARRGAGGEEEGSSRAMFSFLLLKVLGHFCESRVCVSSSQPVLRDDT